MGFSYNVNVLNQKGSPALYTDIFANRPAAGYQGRLFVSTDTAAIYEDTGTAWTLIANVSSGAGTLEQVTTNGNTTTKGISISAGGLSTNSLTDTALTSGSVTFAGAGGLISEDNANLFWDDTNNRLGINTNTPGNSLDVHTGGTTPILALNNTAGSQSAISFLNTSVAKWRIGNTATNTFDVYNFGLSLTTLSINGATNIVSFTESIKISQTASFQATAGYNSIIGTANGFGFQLGTSTISPTFAFNSLTASRNYIFPDAEGTLALTSNLSGYLPLSGGTLTGALNGTSASFSSTITSQANGSTFGTSGNGAIPLIVQANAVSRVIQFLNTAGGTSQILSGGTATTSFIGFNTYLTSDAFRIENDGNIGVGGIPNLTSLSAGIKVLSLIATTADRYSVLELMGNRASGGNQNGQISFLNNNSTIGTVTARITGVNTATSNLGGELTFETKTDAGSISERMRILNGGSINFSGLDATTQYYFGYNRPTATNLLVNGTNNNKIKIQNAESDVIVLNSNGISYFNGGNVGINTTNATRTLSVQGVGGFFNTTGANDSQLLIYNDGTNSIISSTYGSTGSYLPLIFNTQGAERMNISAATGVVKITNLAGTGSRAVLADASGNLSAPVSDETVKENVEPLKYGLNAIMQLNPISFEYIEDYKNYGEGLQIGNIAQDVAKVIPEAVFTTPSTGLMGINYNQFDGIYIKAIQDLNNIIENQNTLIQSLINRIELLENK